MHSGDQKDGGDHLRDAGSEPRQVVAVGGAWVVGDDDGENVHGGRSSGEVELVASRHGEGRAGVLRAPASALKMKACSVVTQLVVAMTATCGGGGGLRL